MSEYGFWMMCAHKRLRSFNSDSETVQNWEGSQPLKDCDLTTKMTKTEKASEKQSAPRRETSEQILEMGSLDHVLTRFL